MARNTKRLRALFLMLLGVAATNYAITFAGSRIGTPSIPELPRPKIGTPSIPELPRPKIGTPSIPELPRPRIGTPSIPELPRP